MNRSRSRGRVLTEIRSGLPEIRLLNFEVAVGFPRLFLPPGSSGQVALRSFDLHSQLEMLGDRDLNTTW